MAFILSGEGWGCQMRKPERKNLTESGTQDPQVQVRFLPVLDPDLTAKYYNYLPMHQRAGNISKNRHRQDSL